MADGLTIGGTAFAVLVNSWVEQPSLHQGGRGRHRDNSGVSTEDPTTRKRVAECAIDVDDYTAEVALRAACPKGTPVAVAGELPGTGFTAWADINNVTGVRREVDGAQIILRAAMVRFEEV